MARRHTGRGGRCTSGPAAPEATAPIYPVGDGADELCARPPGVAARVRAWRAARASFCSGPGRRGPLSYGAGDAHSRGPGADRGRAGARGDVGCSGGRARLAGAGGASGTGNDRTGGDLDRDSAGDQQSGVALVRGRPSLARAPVRRVSQAHEVVRGGIRSLPTWKSRGFDRGLQDTSRRTGAGGGGGGEIPPASAGIPKRGQAAWNPVQDSFPFHSAEQDGLGKATAITWTLNFTSEPENWKHLVPCREGYA